MISQYLDGKITKKAGLDADFHSQSQVGVVRKFSDVLAQQVSKQWFASLNGISPSQQAELARDSQDGGWAIMRPKEKHYDVLFNPLAVDGIQGSHTGKGSAISTDASKVQFAQMDGKNKKTPVIMALTSRSVPNQDSTSVSKKTVNESVMVVPGPPSTVNSIPQPKPVAVDQGIYGATSFSSQMDVHTDGTTSPTLDNGTGPSGQSIRVGTLMMDPSWVQSTGRGLFSTDVTSVLNLSF